MEKELSISYAKKDIKYKTYSGMLIIIYKIFLEIGFWYLLQQAYAGLGRYNFEINIGKWALGTILCVGMFLFLPEDENRPSTFFMEFIYLIIIVPMAIILGFSNESIFFYCFTSIGFILCECILRLSKANISIPESNITTKGMLLVLYGTILIVLAGIVLENGMFSLKAINIYNVYSVREEFKLNKYIGYMFSWQYSVVIPFLLVRTLRKKKYIQSVAFVILQLILYLYSGQKGVLFIIPLVLGVYFVAGLKRFNMYFVSAFCGGVVLFTVGGFFSSFANNLFDLFVRRVLLLPAWLKYLYYDFFMEHRTMGLAGTLWGKFLNAYQPYPEGIGYVISDKYFQLPEVNSNTGFIAEGMSRYGVLGIVLAFILLAFVFWVVDYFARKNGYKFAVCLALFSVILLNDGAIIDTLIFGHLLILVLICLFYNQKYDKKEKYYERTITEKDSK